MTQGSTMAISCNQEKNNMPKDILCIAQLNQYLKSKYGSTRARTYWNSPKWDCVALEGITQVSHHVASNKAVKGFDYV